MYEVLIWQTVILLILGLTLVIVVTFLHCALQRSLGKQACQYCDMLFIRFSVDKEWLWQNLLPEAQPEIQWVAGSGAHRGEVFNTNDEVFFASPALLGHRGTLKICGVLQLPLCLSLCFIIKDDSSMQHKKHIAKFCTTAPTGDRWGREMDGREWHINPAGSSLTNRMP